VIAFLDTPQDLSECEKEIGCHVLQLFTPLTRRNAQDDDAVFAMDNGAFSKFDAAGFCRMLTKHAPRRHLCKFVAVPDIVGSAIRTREAFDHWHTLDEMDGWPLAFVCQDGQESFPIPWKEISAVFIGGSTEWKLSEAASQIVQAAKVMGKWCHVGRVNTPGRFEYFDNLGADSCDGTGIARYSEMRSKIYENSKHPKLDLFTKQSN
jgi:hypothetical protein